MNRGDLVPVFALWLVASLLLSTIRADTKFDGSKGEYNCDETYPITFVIYDGWFCSLDDTEVKK